MLADDTACNSRNKFPGSVYANAGRRLDLYGDNIEVDYRGYEVTVENFIRVLTGMFSGATSDKMCPDLYCRTCGRICASFEAALDRRSIECVRVHDRAWGKRVPQVPGQ